jgi:hypothetical protein
MTKEQDFYVRRTNDWHLSFTHAGLLIFFPEYMSESTLRRMKNENPWLFDRVLVGYDANFKKSRIKYNIPQSLKDQYPNLKDSFSLDNHWDYLAKDLIYSYLIQEVFSSIEKVNDKGFGGTVITKTGLELAYVYYDDGEHLDFNGRTQDKNFNAKSKDALSIMEEEAKAFIDKLQYIDFFENYAAYVEKLPKRTHTYKFNFFKF